MGTLSILLDFDLLNPRLKSGASYASPLTGIIAIIPVRGFYLIAPDFNLGA